MISSLKRFGSFWKSTFKHYPYAKLIGIALGFMLGYLLAQRKALDSVPIQNTNDEDEGALQLIGERLSREDIIQLITRYGDCGGLNLIDADLTGADLSGMDLRNVIFGNYEERRGAILERASLRNTNLSGTSLCYTDLTGAILRGANLSWTDMSKSNLYKADCRDANFDFADLWQVNLSQADLSGARLEFASFLPIDLSGTKLTRRETGNTLLFENEFLLRKFHEGHFPDCTEQERNSHNLKGLYWGSEAFRLLKGAWLAQGRYDEASWAYVKERKLRRMTHWPLRRAKACYHDGDPFLRERKMSDWLFAIRHLAIYIFDWFLEVAIGYGERPLRTFGLAMITVLAFAVWYWLFGYIGTQVEITRESAQIVVPIPTYTFLDALVFSLSTFTTMSFSDLNALTLPTKLAATLEAASGISLLSLVMFSLGKRISRS